MSEARRALFDGQKVDLTNGAKVTHDLGERFNAMSLEDQRTIVRALLAITVGFGRKLDRVSIAGPGVRTDDEPMSAKDL